MFPIRLYTTDPFLGVPMTTIKEMLNKSKTRNTALAIMRYLMKEKWPIKRILRLRF